MVLKLGLVEMESPCCWQYSVRTEWRRRAERLLCHMAGWTASHTTSSPEACVICWFVGYMEIR